MRIKMLETKNFKLPTDWRVTIKFKANCEYTTKREWGETMVKAGVAVELDAPARPVVQRRPKPVVDTADAPEVPGEA